MEEKDKNILPLTEQEKENLFIYEQVRAVPDDAQKPITGGRLSGMTNISPMYRIKTLSRVFGPIGKGWKLSVEHWKETFDSIKEVMVCAKAEICFRIKDEDKWSEPIVGFGGSKLLAQEKAGLYFDDEAYKKATTDAISSACKLLGVAADVYWADDPTKYEPLPTNNYDDEPFLNDEPITEDQETSLVEYLDSVHKTPESLCEYLEIISLRDLTIGQLRLVKMGQFDNAKRESQAYLERRRKAKISPENLAKLKVMLNSAGMNQSDFCKTRNVTALEELTNKQYAESVEFINAYKEKMNNECTEQVDLGI